MDSNNKLELLRDELKKVSGIAPKGSHVQVAKEVGISTMYLYQIRTGSNATVDSEENRKFIQSIINEYRVIIRKEQEKYQSI